ncbi:UNVERIFIED_CONTAM: Transcription factor iws1, partial [Siphonaria sp. JEL0065]
MDLSDDDLDLQHNEVIPDTQNIGGSGSGDKNITLDDIFGGDSDLDENEDKMAFSDSEDEKDVPAPVVLPKFKKKQRSEGDEQPISQKRPKNKSSKRSRSNDVIEEVEPEKVLDPETAKLKQASNDFEEALNRIKHKRAKKLDGDDPEIDEMIVNLVDKMKEAANADIEFNKLKQPAIAKIKLLPKVTAQLAKMNLAEQFLDNNILDGMKIWLEPLKDGSLPNLDVQMSMFNALSKFPIRTEHLRESKIGRIVMFYTKCDRTTPSALKIANELLEKWMRPILGRTADYKKMGLKTVSFDASEV